MKLNKIVTPIVKKAQVAEAPKIAKTTAKIADKSKINIKDLMGLQRDGTLERGLFIANAFTFLLGSRLLTSRDKDEKREILIRDVPTIIIAVLGVPFFTALIAKGVQRATGLALVGKVPNDGFFANAISKITKKPPMKDAVISYGQVDDVYRYDKNLASGFKGFCKRISDMGGDLKKVFSYLGGDVKKQLSAEKYSGGNEKLIKALFKDKKLRNNIERAMSETKNNVWKNAGFFKTLPKIAGFAATFALVGVLIPKLNIHITETISKKRSLEQQKTNSVAVSDGKAKADAVKKS